MAGGKKDHTECGPGILLWVAFFSSVAGALFCGTEVILSFSGRTLCHAQTCAVVEEFSLFSRPVFSFFALAYFLLQALLLWNCLRQRLSTLWLLLAIASAALGAEAVLLGRQFVDYHMHCPFCLTVAFFVLTSTLSIMVLTRHFWAFAPVLGVAIALLVTPLSIKPLAFSATKRIYRGTPTEKWILIYAPNCPHCHEVLSFCESLSDIDLLLCPKRRALAFLHLLGVNGVPVLVVDRGGEKRVLVGSGFILHYLKQGERHEVPEGLLAPSGVCEEGRKCEPLNEGHDLPLLNPF